jgi:hypothetical protein
LPEKRAICKSKEKRAGFRREIKRIIDSLTLWGNIGAFKAFLRRLCFAKEAQKHRMGIYGAFFYPTIKSPFL